MASLTKPITRPVSTPATRIPQDSAAYVPAPSVSGQALWFNESSNSMYLALASVGGM